MNATVLALSPVRPPDVCPDRIGFELGWDYAHHRLQPPPPFTRGGFGPARRASRRARHLRPAHAGGAPARAPVAAAAAARLAARSQRRRLPGHAALPAPARSQPLPDHARGARPVATRRQRLDRPGAQRRRLRRRQPGDDEHEGQPCQGGARLPLGEPSGRASQQPAAAGSSAPARRLAGLTAPQWRRVATLCSFVEPLDHAAGRDALPMHVLLAEPAAALQSGAGPAGPAQPAVAAAGLEPPLRPLRSPSPGPGAAPRLQGLHDRPRAARARSRPDGDAQALRWAVEDAWTDERVLKRWQTFAGPLTPAACEALVSQAAARKLATSAVETIDPAQACEGWSLETRGWVAIAPGPLPRRSAAG